MRITGPYRHRQGFRYRITEAPGVLRWAPSAPTEAEAAALAEAFADGLRAREAQTVAGLAERYLAHLQDRGNKPLSIRSAAGKCNQNFPPVCAAVPKIAHRRHFVLASGTECR